MKAEQRAELIKDLMDRCLETLTRKGNDYKTIEDVNGNFKELARELSTPERQLTPYDIWYVFFAKHLSAVKNFITRGSLESEPIEDRILDAVNYLLILHTLIEENKRIKDVPLRKTMPVGNYKP